MASLPAVMHGPSELSSQLAAAAVTGSSAAARSSCNTATPTIMRITAAAFTRPHDLISWASPAAAALAVASDIVLSKLLASIL
jgi:hypothetical protein